MAVCRVCTYDTGALLLQHVLQPQQRAHNVYTPCMHTTYKYPPSLFLCALCALLLVFVLVTFCLVADVAVGLQWVTLVMVCNG